jgi:hypothetical protein
VLVVVPYEQVFVPYDQVSVPYALVFVPYALVSVQVSPLSDRWKIRNQADDHKSDIQLS